MQLRSLLIGIVAGVLLAHADPAVAQNPDSLPTRADDDRIDDEYEDDEESDPRLRRALQAYLAELAPMTPPEIVGDTTAPGVQAGGTEIRARIPGTETLVRDGPDDPRDAPAPEIYGEEICPPTEVEGQFEPAQGTWQDDPTFIDQPGKQIVRISRVLFRAELKMVTGRASLLHGIERAVGGAEPRRDEIFIKGKGSGEPIPVKFRFTLTQPGGQRIIHESEIVGTVPIGGSCKPDAVQSWEVTLDARYGIPEDRHFTFEDGEYLLEAELVQADGSGTGIKVGVLGQAVSTHAPSVAFRLVTLLSSPAETALRPDMEEAVRQLARSSAVTIPDYFPVINAPLKTQVFPTRDRRHLLGGFTRNRTLSEVVENLGPELLSVILRDAIREEMARELQVGTLMTGFDRIVVALTDMDFRLAWMGSLELTSTAVAFAISQKVIFVNLEDGGDAHTVAHEIVHTLPYPWWKTVESDCYLDYHGVEADVAEGHSVYDEGAPGRFRYMGYPHIFGAYGKGTPQWIEQCTYWHVLEVLSASVPDPPILLVQGYVGRHEGRTAGAFQPFYEFDSIEDLPPGGEGSWAIVLQDGAGATLARHDWEPIWEIPDVERERNLIAFAFRLRRPEGLARVVLEGPDGPLDTRTLSANPPRVTIVDPLDGAPGVVEDGGMRVEWSAIDPDGDTLLSTVLYSSDAGDTWVDVAVETAATSIVVPLDPFAPPDAHRILVRATDGGRSADATVAFKVGE